MIIKTRKLPATSTEGERMRATADNGAVLTVPFPYYAADPNESVAEALARAYDWTISRASDRTWEVYPNV